MNYTLKTLVLAAAVALVPAMAGAQDFYQTYEKADQARIEQNLAYNGPVQGVWKDADSFIYSNHEQDGDKVLGVVFESNQVPDYKMPGWIEKYAAQKGVGMSPDAAALLSEFAGVDMAKVALEIDKLLKLLPQGCKRISAQDIEANVGMSRDYSVFELTKALSLKDAQKAFRITQFFSSSPKRYPLVVTLAALTTHFIRLLRYHALLQSGTSRSEILAELGINPYFAGEYDTAIKNYSCPKVIKAISVLRNTDTKAKSNGRGEATDGELLQELVSKILFL